MPLLRPCDCLCKIRKAYGLRFHLRSTLYQSLLLLPRPSGSSALKILLHHFVEEFLLFLWCHAFQCSNHHFWFKLHIVNLSPSGGHGCLRPALRNVVPIIHHFRGLCVGSWSKCLFLPSLGTTSGHVSFLSAAETSSLLAEGLSFLI